MSSCLELVKELCYKLNIMAVPINGVENAFGDNMIAFNGA